MEQVIEKQLTLPNVAVQLATLRWGGLEEISPHAEGYSICQRLSDDHSALRIGNPAVREAFPRVRSVAFLSPNSAIKLYPVNRPFRALNCLFEKSFFESATEIDEGQWDEHSGALVSIKNRRLETMMQEIYGELVSPGFAHDLLVEAASTMIMVELARYTQRLPRGLGQSGESQGLAPWQLRRIHERLAASLQSGYPSLSELAKVCGISQSHLMRNFKASTGWPIHKFIVEERLKAAKAMLAKGECNAKEISARLGFRSPAYFATAFRRMTGKTPTEYRREVRTM
jgi:AraC family transcriptional regulator